MLPVHIGLVCEIRIVLALWRCKAKWIPQDAAQRGLMKADNTRRYTFAVIIVSGRYCVNMIILPPLTWFIQISGKTAVTNIYTGSLGTDPSKGCLHTSSFNYRVYVQPQRNDEPACICAEYNIRSPWKDGCQIISSELKNFTVNSEGIKSVTEWLAVNYHEQANK